MTQQVVNALTLGSVIALFALGYSMVYGILTILNFAHGEVFMIGAFVGYLVETAFIRDNQLTANPILIILLALLAAMLACGLLAVTIEFLAYRPLRNAARLAPLISALAMSVLLRNIVGVVTQFRSRPIATDLLLPPRWSLEIGGSTIGANRIVIIVVTFVALIVLELFMARTKAGKAMRACAQDREAASFMGISVNGIISLTFLVGAMMAGIGGVLTGLYYTQIDFAMGFSLGMKAFTAAVLGGIGNLRGAVLGSFILAAAETLGSYYISFTYRDVISFGLLIAILLFKPSGLLGKPIPVKV
ncbi:MAG: branched-chain amino acid ABC transporter permease [Gaiellales bacterium]|nr:branched-chain amino acid ABC transporter permease [Gaiellales bacterium]